jgi:hypothetical protein
MVAVLTVMLWPTALAGSALAGSEREKKSNSCYPTNSNGNITFNLVATGITGYEPGSFKASSSGEGPATISEDGGAAKVEWEFKEAVTDPTSGATDMSGKLEFSIKRAGQKTIKFESRCIAEAVLENDGAGDHLLEAELEGTVKNAPWGNGPAVASILVSGELNADGKGQVSGFTLAVEKGTTCFEPGDEITAKGAPEESSLRANPVLVSNGSPVMRGAGALPPGPWTPQSPCDAVFYN